MLERIVRSPYTMTYFLGFMMLALYDTSQNREWYPLWSALLLAGLIVYIGMILLHNKRHPDQKIKLVTLIPYELKENDEGQQWVTNRACRKVYIFYYFAIPAAALLFIAFPYFPEIPLIVMFVMGTVQYFIYSYEVNKYLK